MGKSIILRKNSQHCSRTLPAASVGSSKRALSLHPRAAIFSWRKLPQNMYWITSALPTTAPPGLWHGLRPSRRTPACRWPLAISSTTTISTRVQFTAKKSKIKPFVFPGCDFWPVYLLILQSHLKRLWPKPLHVLPWQIPADGSGFCWSFCQNWITPTLRLYRQ